MFNVIRKVGPFDLCRDKIFLNFYVGSEHRIRSFWGSSFYTHNPSSSQFEMLELTRWWTEKSVVYDTTGSRKELEARMFSTYARTGFAIDRHKLTRVSQFLDPPIQYSSHHYTLIAQIKQHFPITNESVMKSTYLR